MCCVYEVWRAYAVFLFVYSCCLFFSLFVYSCCLFFDSGIKYLREREARERASERGAAHKTHTHVPAEREEEASEEEAPPKGRGETEAVEAAGERREPEAVGQGHVAKSGGGGRQEEAEEEEEEAAAADGEEGEEGAEGEEEEDRWLAAHLGFTPHFFFLLLFFMKNYDLNLWQRSLSLTKSKAY